MATNEIITSKTKTTMKTITYKHCVITPKNEIYLSNNNMSWSPLFDTYLDNVNIHIDENGILDVSGDEDEYYFAYEDTLLTDITDVRSYIKEKDIKHFNGIKIFGFYISKPYDYIERGWHRLNKTRKTRKILSNYTIHFM